MNSITFFFPHDYDAASDAKLLKLRTKFNNAEGYGMFWMALEAMAKSPDGKIDTSSMAELSLSYGIPQEKWKPFIDYCVEIGLFHSLGTQVYSVRMLEHKEWRKERSESGKRGAFAKWSKVDGSANAQLMATKQTKPKQKTDGHDKIRQDIEKWFSKMEIQNPSAYLSSIEKKFSWMAIEKAWKDARRGVGINSPSELYSRCLHYQKATLLPSP